VVRSERGRSRKEAAEACTVGEEDEEIEGEETAEVETAVEADADTGSEEWAVPVSSAPKGGLA
jgi:hypothetical protein